MNKQGERKMYLLEELNRINTIHQLILTHKTGTPDEFASKMCMSRRNLYRVLRDLEKLGAEISYSKVTHSFYYKRKLRIKMFLEINGDECIKISGGYFKNNNVPLYFCAEIRHRR